MNINKNYKFETKQLHVGQELPDPATGARAVPLYLSTSFVFRDSAQAAARFDASEDGYIYTRISNPTTDVFEQRIAALEGGAAAVATASGQAAVTAAIQNIAGAGDHIVADVALYGGTHNLFAHTFKEFGISATFVDGSDPKNFDKAVQPNTKCFFVETLGNPNSTIVDIEEIAAIAHKHHIPLMADNTFATPYLLRPIERGADIVVHSATKFIGGHGTSIGGVVVDSGAFQWTQTDKFPGITKPNPSYHGAVLADMAKEIAYAAKLRFTIVRDTGAAVSPFNSFMFLQGLETLSLRVERHVSNALKVVDYLAAHPKVDAVNHPKLPGRRDHGLYNRYFPNGGGSIFTFEPKGGYDGAVRFTDKLQLFSLLANVADVKSLVIHPASTTHSQMTAEEQMASGIKPATIRLSIGIEHIDDIIGDLEQALAAV
ncbi:MAG: O-acetylhomoserine aminocarboxypropyltransferase/cysteine synthase [Oscillospiraceae bacterium]|nr:O-acetylhomoserine aminocarboxypropyltransferase/cysteine synthase [Oscillospiraceae bacterium]